MLEPTALRAVHRIEELTTLLGDLRAAGVHLHVRRTPDPAPALQTQAAIRTPRARGTQIISLGFKDAIVPHMQTAGLLKHFAVADIYGQVGPPPPAARSSACGSPAAVATPALRARAARAIGRAAPQDAPEMRMRSFVKGEVIRDLMRTREWRRDQARALAAAGPERVPRSLCPPVPRIHGDRRCPWRPRSQVLFIDDSSDHIDGAQAVCRTLLLPDRQHGMTSAHFAEIRAMAFPGAE